MRCTQHQMLYTMNYTTYQFLYFKQTGGHTVSVNQNEMLVWEQVDQGLKNKSPRPSKMNFVQTTTCINWNMNGCGDFLVWTEIAASSHRLKAELAPKITALSGVLPKVDCLHKHILWKHDLAKVEDRPRG